MSDVRLTSLSHGGGCGCKIAPAALTEILAKVPRPLLDPALLVGIETSDDAAVYRLNDEQAVVATTDFFMPIVDDPYDFGRIAATNALSDIYAMGARPIFALAIVGMPLNKLPVDVIQKILAGGASVCEAAGIPIAGGHSIDSVEPIYGLVALGVIHPQRVKRNSTARAGDAIVLGKALGVGILSAALKKGALPAGQHHAAQQRGPSAGGNSRRARDDRRHRFRPARPSRRDLPRLAARRARRVRLAAGPAGGAVARAAGFQHRRRSAQLGELRP
jgi:selenide,water dikinase